MAVASFGFKGPRDRWALRVWDVATGKELCRSTGEVWTGNAPPEFDRFLGKKVNVRYRVGASEAVIEGMLAAVDDAGLAVRGHRNEFVHLEWDDLLAARLVASL